MFLFKAFIFLQNLVFPQCCLICGNINRQIICNKCKPEVYSRVNFKYNTKIQKEYFFDSHIYVFEYQGFVRDLILNYKFKDKSYLYKFFSEIIIKNKKICRILKSYDIIIPVPIHFIRKMMRGYNQSELIAKELANNIQNIKLENEILIKKVNNKKQSGLNRSERIENVKDVYQIINGEKIKDKKIVLFDDIYTTGNTVNEISRILKLNGARKILIFTIAKD